MIGVPIMYILLWYNEIKYQKMYGWAESKIVFDPGNKYKAYTLLSGMVYIIILQCISIFALGSLCKTRINIRGEMEFLVWIIIYCWILCCKICITESIVRFSSFTPLDQEWSACATQSLRNFVWECIERACIDSFHSIFR